MKRIALVAAALALAACDRAAPEPPPKPGSTATQSGPPEAAGIRYLERYTGGAKAGERVPLVIAIHGLGDRPENFAPVLASLAIKARLVVPYGEPWNDGFSWFPAGSLGDDAKLADVTSRAADRLAKMIEALVRAQPAAGKPIVTGFSQGGMLSFTLAVRHPEVVGAAFPVGGLLAPGLVPSSWPSGVDRPPITAFHGTADERVPFARARDTVAKLKAAGFTSTLVEYPGVGHAMPPALRADLHRAIAEAAMRGAE